MIIAFVGHSVIAGGDSIKRKVKTQIRKYIPNEKNIICYLGGYGGFDEICACACRELKKEYNGVELVYITPYFHLSEQAKIKRMLAGGLYDSCLYPPIENTPQKFAISKRNEWMMTNADVIIAYVHHDYGGAYQSLQIAKRKKKKIINVFSEE